MRTAWQAGQCSNSTADPVVALEEVLSMCVTELSCRLMPYTAPRPSAARYGKAVLSARAPHTGIVEFDEDRR